MGDHLLAGAGDYALIARRLAESLRAQNVLYAEVTLSVGVMLLRKQDVAANFVALREAAATVPGIRLAWIFDAVRQWGADPAMEVARIAAQLAPLDVVAFGIGGDELAIPAKDFSRVYEFVAGAGLHRLIHAGETGGPDSVREAVELLGVERIGHGIGVLRDERAMDFLAERGIPIEVCPTSNLRTGALARQLECETATYSQHPLPLFIRRGLQVTLSSDDPAMFETSLNREYLMARRMGLSAGQLLRLTEASFKHAFLDERDRQGFLGAFCSGAATLGLPAAAGLL